MAAPGESGFKTDGFVDRTATGHLPSRYNDDYGAGGITEFQTNVGPGPLTGIATNLEASAAEAKAAADAWEAQHPGAGEDDVGNKIAVDPAQSQAEAHSVGGYPPEAGYSSES